MIRPLGEYNPQPKRERPEKPKKHLAKGSSLRAKPVTSDEADLYLANVYYQHVKAQPCCICKSTTGVQAHHFSGMSNPKQPGTVLKRSHVGLPKYAALPVCEKCHGTAHAEKRRKLNEREWVEANVPGGMEGALSLALRLLAEASLEARRLSLAQALEEAA
jgi:hypothetical protein